MSVKADDAVVEALAALLSTLDRLEQESEDGWRIRIVPTIAKRVDAERALRDAAK